jgi:UDP-N-acetylmuramoyl-tripeptide--D-alanyl-D-alanine ligase
MPVLSARRVAEICGGRVIGDGDVRSRRVVADSREVVDGDLFVAVRGGHAFVAEAVASQAAFALVSDVVSVPAGATAVVVDDTVDALGALAASARSAMDVTVVGVTGSYGKTLTKDFIAAALGARYSVHAARGSYNTEVGLPLVVLACPEDAEVLVAELGARREGEIAELCAICRPSIGVLTGVGNTHLEIFGSRRAIARTKSELLASLPADGLAIVPSNDDFLSLLAASTRARVGTVGPGGQTRYRATKIDPTGVTHGSVALAEEVVDVALPVPGRVLMRNAAMAMRVARELGVEATAAGAAIAGAHTTGARVQIVDVGAWTIVNDAYNANPTSVASALRTVRELRPDAPRWAVLGRMAELGVIADPAHRRVGGLARALGYDGVVAVGEGAELIAEAAGDIATRVGSREEAAAFVADRVPSGAVVLVKGSLVTGLKDFPDVLARHDRASQEV